MFYINLTVTTDFFYYLSDEKAWHISWRNGPRRRDTTAFLLRFRWWWHDGTVEMVYNMEWYEYIRKVFSVKGTIIRISLKFCLLARAFDYNKIILLCSWIKFYLYGKIFFIDRGKKGMFERDVTFWDGIFLILCYLCFCVAVCLWCVIWIDLISIGVHEYYLICSPCWTVNFQIFNKIAIDFFPWQLKLKQKVDLKRMLRVNSQYYISNFQHYQS